MSGAPVELVKMEELKRGIALFWNFRWTEAEELFKTHMNNDPAGWPFLTYWCMVGWAFATTSEDKARLDEAFARFDHFRSVIKKVKHSKVPDPKDSPLLHSYTLFGITASGRLALLDAFLKFKIESRMKGAYMVRKAWKSYQLAIAFRDALPATAPSYADLCACVDSYYGLFLFMVGIVPREWQWILEILGFEGNRPKGLQLLTRSSQTKSYLALESSFNLIWIRAFFFDDYVGAHAIAKDQLVDFPRAAHVKYMAGYMCRRQGLLEDAAKYFEAAHADSSGVPHFQMYCEYERAYGSYLNLEWHAAMERLRTFVDTCTVSAFRAFSMFMLAMSYEMLFQHEKAMALMKSVGSVVRKSYDYDEYAGRKAQKYIAKKGISLFERKFFMAQLHNEAIRPDESNEALDTAATLVEDAEDKASLAFLRGSNFLKKKDYAQAKQFFDEALSLEKSLKTELYIVPHSVVGLAEIELAKGSMDEADRLFKKAKGYSGYDFSQLTQFRILRGQDMISEQQRSSGPAR